MASEEIILQNRVVISWHNHPHWQCLGDLRSHHSLRLFVDLEHFIKKHVVFKIKNEKKNPLCYPKGDLFLIDRICLNAFLSLCRSIKTMTHLVT